MKSLLKALVGTGQKCTKTKLHETQNLHKMTKLHEDNFAPRVNSLASKIDPWCKIVLVQN